MLFQLLLAVAENSNRTFWVNGKHPLAPPLWCFHIKEGQLCLIKQSCFEHKLKIIHCILYLFQDRLASISLYNNCHTIHLRKNLWRDQFCYSDRLCVNCLLQSFDTHSESITRKSVPCQCNEHEVTTTRDFSTLKQKDNSYLSFSVFRITFSWQTSLTWSPSTPDTLLPCQTQNGNCM